MVFEYIVTSPKFNYQNVAISLPLPLANVLSCWTYNYKLTCDMF